MFQRYYIRIPPTSGIPETYVRVDPANLPLTILTLIYTKNDRTGQYRRALDIEPNIETALDVSALVKRGNELISELSDYMNLGTVVSTELSRGLLSSLNQVLMLVQLLAGGDLANAAKVLDTIIYGTMSAGTVAAEALDQLQIRVDDLVETAEGLSGVIIEEDVDGHYRKSLEDAAANIKEYLQIVAHLKGRQVELQNLLEYLRAYVKEWEEFSSGHDPLVSSVVLELNGSEGGFCRRASQFVIGYNGGTRDPADKIAILEACRAAQILIEGLKSRHKQLANDREELMRMVFENEAFKSDDLTEAARLRELLRSIEQAQVAKLRPFELSADICTREEYEEALYLAADNLWGSPMAVRDRLVQLYGSIMRMVDASPDFCESARQAIDSAEYYIERVDTILSLSVEGLSSPAVREAQAKNDQPELPADRLDELYQLILAVGALKFCTFHNLNGSNVKNMLGMLAILDKVSIEEIELYSSALKDRVLLRSYDVETDHKGRSKIDLWREIEIENYDWIRFAHPNTGPAVPRRSWRLLLKAKPKGEFLAEQFGLTEDDVQSAYALFRQAQEEKHAERQRSRKENQ